jgi:GDP-6-deoxy-D-talose 4-dehydrogenase
MATALVTGASGFTGPYVIEQLLDQGYEVHGAARAHSSDSNICSHKIDLCDPQNLAALVAEVQPTVVVHLAAIAFVGHRDFADMYLSNVVGTRNLLAALADGAPTLQRVLLASSANVYGNNNINILTEETQYNPQNDYAVSKCAMEMMAKLWFQRLPITIVRPFNYTGVGQSPDFLVPKIVNHFAGKKPVIELGNIDVFRDFSDVRSVANAYAHLLKDGAPGEVYNVCSGREYDINYILDTLSDLSGHSIEVIINPEFVRANEVKRLKGSNKKLAAAIGSTGSIPLEETLSWMLQQASHEPSG